MLMKDNAKGHCSFVHNVLQFSPLSYTVWVAFLSKHWYYFCLNQ